MAWSACQAAVLITLSGSEPLLPASSAGSARASGERAGLLSGPDVVDVSPVAAAWSMLRVLGPGPAVATCRWTALCVTICWRTCNAAADRPCGISDLGFRPSLKRPDAGRGPSQPIALQAGRVQARLHLPGQLHQKLWRRRGPNSYNQAVSRLLAVVAAPGSIQVCTMMQHNDAASCCSCTNWNAMQQSPASGTSTG